MPPKPKKRRDAAPPATVVVSCRLDAADAALFNTLAEAQNTPPGVLLRDFILQLLKPHRSST